MKESTQQKLNVQSGSSFVQQQYADEILASMGGALITTDIQNKLIYLNPAAEVMTGWSLGEVNGVIFSDIFNIIDAETFEPVVSSILHPTVGNGKAELPMDCIFIRRDGFELYVQVCSTPIYDGQAQVVGAVHVLHDVSQLQVKAIKMTHYSQYDVLTDLPKENY